MGSLRISKIWAKTPSFHPKARHLFKASDFLFIFLPEPGADWRKAFREIGKPRFIYIALDIAPMSVGC